MVLSSFIQFYNVSQSVNKFYLVLTSFIQFYRVLNFTGLYRILPTYTPIISFTLFKRVLQGFTQFYNVSPNVIKFFPCFIWFYLVLPSFIGLNLWFNEFYLVVQVEEKVACYPNVPPRPTRCVVVAAAPKATPPTSDQVGRVLPSFTESLDRILKNAYGK